MKYLIDPMIVFNILIQYAFLPFQIFKFIQTKITALQPNDRNAALQNKNKKHS